MFSAHVNKKVPMGRELELFDILMGIIKKNKLSAYKVSMASGIGLNTLCAVDNSKRHLRVCELEAVSKVLGYEVAIFKKDEVDLSHLKDPRRFPKRNKDGWL